MSTSHNKPVVIDSSSSFHTVSSDQSSFQPITLGNVLGMGAFCKVQEITFASSDGQGNHSSKRYVVKSLRHDEDILNENEGHHTPVEELRSEAQLLSHLSAQNQHDNIIQLHAVITRPIRNDKDNSDIHGSGKSLFLILERLESTLRDKLFQWNHQLKLTRFANRKIMHESTIPTLRDRLAIGSNIASALQHMHSHSIMHRDIKPENVGFDANGRAKLFDLGFARKYKHDDRHMTGMIGTQRYMAPELVKSAKHYDLSVDVYSFGLVLWELCAMEQPFEEYYFGGLQEFERMVTYGGERPCMFPHWSKRLQSLLQSCWSDGPSDRPCFGEILKALRSDDIVACSRKNLKFGKMGSLKVRRLAHSPSGGLRRVMTLMQRS